MECWGGWGNVEGGGMGDCDLNEGCKRLNIDWGSKNQLFNTTVSECNG